MKILDAVMSAIRSNLSTEEEIAELIEWAGFVARDVQRTRRNHSFDKAKIVAGWTKAIRLAASKDF